MTWIFLAFLTQGKFICLLATFKMWLWTDVAIYYFAVVHKRGGVQCQTLTTVFISQLCIWGISSTVSKTIMSCIVYVSTVTFVLLGYFCNSLIGLCDHGFSGQSRCWDHNPVDGLTTQQNSGLGYNDLKFRHFCSKIPTVDTFGGHYSQMNMG